MFSIDLVVGAVIVAQLVEWWQLTPEILVWIPPSAKISK